MLKQRRLFLSWNTDTEDRIVADPTSSICVVLLCEIWLVSHCDLDDFDSNIKRGPLYVFVVEAINGDVNLVMVTCYRD